MSVVPEPSLRTAKGGTGHYRGRWRWWYSSIADFRLANPGCTNKQVAEHLQKAENTISAIVSTDLYREYEAQRRQAWRERNENVLREKLTGVTILALDSAAAQLKKKGDQVPLTLARDLIETGLDRLGFGPQPAPSVVVNNGVQVNAPAGAVSVALLDEARSALRAVEQKKLSPALQELPVPDDLDKVLDLDAIEAEEVPSTLEGPLPEGLADREAERVADEVEQEVLREIALQQASRVGNNGGGAPNAVGGVESSEASSGGEAE